MPPAGDFRSGPPGGVGDGMDANDQHLRAGLGELVAAVLEPELRSMGASMGVLVWTTEPAGAAAGPSAPVAELLWSFGLPQELAHSWCRIPLDAPLPITEAIRAPTGDLGGAHRPRPTVSDAGRGAGDRCGGDDLGAGPSARSVPVGVVGALGVGFPRPRPVAPAEVAALAALADRGAGVLAAAGLLPCQSAELRPIGADEFRAAVPRPGGPTVAAGAAGSDNRAGRAVPTGLSAPQEAGAGLGLGGVDLGLLETLLIHAPVGVAVLDRELRFVLVNPRAG